MLQEAEKIRLQEDPGWFKSIQGNAMYTTVYDKGSAVKRGSQSQVLFVRGKAPEGLTMQAPRKSRVWSLGRLKKNSCCL